MPRPKPFWETLDHWGDRDALITAASGPTLSYSALHECAHSAARRLQLSRKGLVFVYPDFDCDGIVAYLSALISGHTVHLSSGRIFHAAAAALIEAYQPEWILWKTGAPCGEICSHYVQVANIAGHNALLRKQCSAPPPHEDLTVVSSTSGSTGNAKFVRHSTQAMIAATDQVVSALRINGDDRTFLSLPFTYVYGLSVINSHLRAGASVVLEHRTAADRYFWEDLCDCRATSLPGVSLTYELMRQLRAQELPLNCLRKLTHAGEPISQAIAIWLHEHYGRRGAQIFLMYGQTEACGRITVLPPDLLPKSAGSVGYTVQDGHLTISKDGEIHYHGPNVMLGYATCREDLSRGDDQRSQLSTGDLGYLDANGLLYVTGRIGRWCKLHGQRLSLDDIEAYFRDVCPVAALDGGGTLVLFCEHSAEPVRQKIRQFAAHMRLPPQYVEVRQIPTLPRTANGKLSYSTLMRARL